MTAAPLYLGVDIGTGSIKGVAATVDGTIMASTSIPAGMTRPQPGFAEADARETWWDGVCAVLADLVRLVDPASIAGLAVSGLGPCLVVTGDDLEPLRPAILYGIDARARHEIEEIDDILGRDFILDRCGKELSSQAVGPKLLWVSRHEPEIWRRTTRWFSSHSFIAARLTGEWVLDHQTASQCDPLYDILEQDWARDWAERILPGLELPRLVWPHEIVGRVTAEAARVTGLPVGIPVMAGTVDAWAEAFSAGVRKPGDMMMMYGSTMFLIQQLPAPTATRGLWTTSGVHPGSHTIAAGMSTSGSLTDWVRQTVGAVSYDELAEQARNVPAGSEGLVMLPYFAGERSPIYDPDARGVIVGLTLNHTPSHLFRAAHEAVGYAVRQVLKSMEDVVGPPARAVAVGGGTRDQWWPQIVSDIMRREQMIPRITVGASYGDALLAAIGTGAVDLNTDWARAHAVIEPRAANAAIYDELFDIYARLYPATVREVHRLAAIQGQQPSAISDVVPPGPRAVDRVRTVDSTVSRASPDVGSSAHERVGVPPSR